MHHTEIRHSQLDYLVLYRIVSSDDSALVDLVSDPCCVLAHVYVERLWQASIITSQ